MKLTTTTKTPNLEFTLGIRIFKGNLPIMPEEHWHVRYFKMASYPKWGDGKTHLLI